MFKRICITVVTFFVAGAAFAQTTTNDLEARVKEMQRQIDILTQEIEAIKTGEAAKKPVQADTSQYGLGAAASKVYRADQGVSFGGYGEFRYQKPQAGIASADVVPGLESSRFSAEDGVHEGKQGGASAAAQDLAFVGRLDWHPVEGTLFGGSLYSGGSGQGAGYRGRVTLGELHADSKFRGFSL